MIPYVEKGDERKRLTMKLDSALEKMAEGAKFKRLAL